MNFFIIFINHGVSNSTLENNNRKIIYIYTRRFNSEVENSDFLVRHIDVDLEYHAMFYAPYAASVSFFCQREGA